MTTSSTRTFLSAVMQQIRRQRPPLNPSQLWFSRVEQVPAGNYAEVWFLTRGCSWDLQGGCTMCNYGRGPRRAVGDIVDSVRRGLEQIDVHVNELMVAPSGGMLDPHEVPLEARRRIYALVRDFPAETFLIETQPETVTEQALAELVRAIPGKQLCLEMGLESSCPWVGHFCINRGHTPDQFKRGVDISHRYGVATYGNVSLGSAFLSPAEAIEDAVRTIRWIHDLGVHSAVVFPLHVKPYTLLDHLQAMGLYEPPSLWSLVEVLTRCADQSSRVEISWYRSYYDDDTKIRRSPHTCAGCYSQVLSLLDRYRAEQSAEAIAELDAVDCSCRTEWRKQMKQSPEAPLAERLISAYCLLVEKFGLEMWWANHGTQTQADVADTGPALMNPDGYGSKDAVSGRRHYHAD